MSIVSVVVERLRSIVHRARAERDMDEEIRFHLDRETERNIRQGMSSDEARRHAHISFGGVERMKERTRHARGVQWLDDLAHDVRGARRSLARNRTFTAVAVLTLSVGIGANTAIFSVVQGVLIRPLPYPDADRIVRVAAGAAPQTGLLEYPLSEAAYWHFVRNQRSFEAFGGYTASGERWRVPLLGDGTSREVTRQAIEVRALEVLGVMPLLGRLPTREEELTAPPSPPVVLISHGLWVEHFGADPSIIGRTITLRFWSAEIIGVMPQGFDFPSSEVDVWTLRARFDPDSGDVMEHGTSMIGRLAPGVTIAQATAEAEEIIAGFDQLPYTPQRLSNLFSGTAVVQPLKDDLVGGARLPLLIAIGTAAFVLLIAVTNVANLLLVRAESRRREQAIRVALGSGQGRLMRYAIVESAVLTTAGCIGGIGLAYIGTSAIVAAGPVSIPRLDEVDIDGTVLSLTIVASVIVAFLFGLLPATGVGRGGALPGLRAGGAGSTIGRSGTRVLGGFVITQVALALVLLIGSGLLVRSFQRLHAVDPGFRSEGVLTFRLTPPTAYRYQTPGEADVGQFVYPLLERLAAVPGVQSVGATSSLPLTGVLAESGGSLGPVRIEEFPPEDDELRPNFITKNTTPGYFETMGIPILEGREFLREDHRSDYSGGFIISASVKRRYWPDESALGKQLTSGRRSGPIVGVVDDVHHRDLALPPDEIIHSAQASRNLMIAIRGLGDPQLLVPALRAAVSEVDPDVRLTRVQTMSDIAADSLSRTSFTMTLLLLAGGVALFLAGVGIYGVVSYVASRQAREMGVRMALGAEPHRVRNIVLLRGAALAAAGIVLGLGVSATLSGALSSLLFEVRPLDLPTLLGAAGTLLTVGVVSSVVPASRAGRTPPAIVLRADD